MPSQQDKIFDLIANVSRRSKSEIKLENELAADLGIDSPKGLQLLMELEENFKIEISDEASTRLNTVNDIVLFVEKQTSEK